MIFELKSDEGGISFHIYKDKKSYLDAKKEETKGCDPQSIRDAYDYFQPNDRELKFDKDGVCSFYDLTEGLSHQFLIEGKIICPKPVNIVTEYTLDGLDDN